MKFVLLHRLTLIPRLSTINGLWYSTNSVGSLAECRQKLELFKGGKVDFEQEFATGLAKITLNRPETRNAMTGQMMAELADIVTELEKWSSGKGVLLCGAGTSFCAGQDLDMVNEMKRQKLGLVACTFMQDTLTRLYRLPMVTAALIQGSAVGGGAELTTACDFRLMLADSKITFVHVRRGIVTGWGGGTFLVRLMGADRAAMLLLSARPIGSQDALRSGLATAILQSPSSDHEGAIEAEAMTWLSSMTIGAPETIRGVKSVISAARELPLGEAHDSEQRVFDSLFGSPHHK